MPSTTRRLPAVLLLALALPLALAACAPATVPVDGAASEAAEPSSAASETPDGGESGLSDDITFAAGSQLDPATQAQWGDAMISDEAYAPAAVDDGNGNWSYTHLATQCVVGFWQGDISSLPAAADDEALSDEVLAYFFQGEAEEVSPYAENETLPLQLGGIGKFDVRTVAGTNPETGGGYLVSARGFDAFHGGYVVSVTCPQGQNPLTLRDEIRDTHLSLILS
ncbi:hypothetical protein ACFXQA_09045 [Microbacterium sp. P07]|uniref:hypothetical protein n=1 Tax=Microbacterium sp. P07 TaxID=3366952 RepID=UPI0037476BFB